MTGPLVVEMNMTHPCSQEAGRGSARVWCHENARVRAPIPWACVVLCGECSGEGGTRGSGRSEGAPNSIQGTNQSELFQLKVTEIISNQRTLSQAKNE